MTQMMMTKAMVEVVNECSVLSSKAIDIEDRYPRIRIRPRMGR